MMAVVEGERKREREKIRNLEIKGDFASPDKWVDEWMLEKYTTTWRALTNSMRQWTN